jgi:hypothetical protein
MRSAWGFLIVRHTHPPSTRAGDNCEHTMRSSDIRSAPHICRTCLLLTSYNLFPAESLLTLQQGWVRCHKQRTHLCTVLVLQPKTMTRRHPLPLLQQRWSLSSIIPRVGPCLLTVTTARFQRRRLDPAIRMMSTHGRKGAT